MSGRNNFVGKAFGLFMSLDKMIGGHFEKGLADLKHEVETATRILLVEFEPAPHDVSKI